MQHRDHARLLLLGVWVCVANWSCTRRYSPASGISCNPFQQVTSRAAKVPSVLFPFPSGGAVLLGYVADSVTGNGLRGAELSLIRRASDGSTDTTATYSDSAGGFEIHVPVRGRYYYSVRSLNFAMVRDSIEVTIAAETLRVMMRRGASLCDVRLTKVSLSSLE